MSLKLLLFDLDETVAPDEELNEVLFTEIGAHVERAHCVPGARLVSVVTRTAETLWARGDAASYCQRIGISASEGLWGPFGASADPSLAALHTFAPGYRARVWREALAACDIHDQAAADALAQSFLDERRKRQAAYPWSREALERLGQRYRLGMITNGAPDLQRLKLAGTGLAAYFEPLIVSGDLGVGKPEAAIFAAALARAGVAPEDAVMIGDNWRRDVLGAADAGLRAVWINPRGAPMPMPDLPLDPARVRSVADLRALPTQIAEWEAQASD